MTRLSALSWLAKAHMDRITRADILTYKTVNTIPYSRKNRLIRLGIEIETEGAAIHHAQSTAITDVTVYLRRHRFELFLLGRGLD